MKAVRIHAHGGPEVLRYETVPDPVPRADEVLVRVRACALNHLDIWNRKGLPRPMVPLPHILGSDIAGEVVAAGELVDDLKPGDAVILNPGVSCGRCRYCLSGQDNMCAQYHLLGAGRNGGYAQLVAVPRANAIRKPANLTFAEAAAVPLVFLTAWHMLVTRARVQPGEEVFIWGASSGVGSAAIQIAKLLGARVIAATQGEEKEAKARQLGADSVIDYKTTDVLRAVRDMTGGRGVDVVFEHVGEATWDASIRMLAKGGRLVTCGNTSGWQGQTDIRYVFARQLSILGSYMGSKGELLTLLPWVEAGRLRPVVHAVLPLEDAAEAHRILESQAQFGKVVLEPPAD
ncbi:MAG: alcohol dehydrogenase [Firmicutes bacterium ZCTH02-B6]|nr:MAG: alcohol dehydrogenase [Firmicutes bacterium ZCTH02-B6]